MYQGGKYFFVRMVLQDEKGCDVAKLNCENTELSVLCKRKYKVPLRSNEIISLTRALLPLVIVTVFFAIWNDFALYFRIFIHHEIHVQNKDYCSSNEDDDP